MRRREGVSEGLQRQGGRDGVGGRKVSEGERDGGTEEGRESGKDEVRDRITY